MQKLIVIASLLVCACSSSSFDVADPGDVAGVDGGELDIAGDVDGIDLRDEGAGDVDAEARADSGRESATKDAGDVGAEIDPVDVAGDVELDAGDAGDVAAPVDFICPRSSDPRSLAEDPYMFKVGDWLECPRSTTLANAHRFSGVFQYEDALTGGELSLDVSINGVHVGSIGPITMSSTSPASFDFSFAPIAGPSYLIRYDAHPSSDRLGTIGVTFDVSYVELQ